MNTLPNAPRNTAISPMSAKYSQSMPTEVIASHRVMDRNVKIPPSSPTIISTKSAINIAVESAERFRFFFAS